MIAVQQPSQSSTPSSSAYTSRESSPMPVRYTLPALKHKQVMKYGLRALGVLGLLGNTYLLYSIRKKIVEENQRKQQEREQQERKRLYEQRRKQQTSGYIKRAKSRRQPRFDEI